MAIAAGFAVFPTQPRRPASFLLLGYAIGYYFSPNTAPALLNLVFFPMSFASGVFIPLQFLPKFVQDIAPYLPTYHLAQLAWVRSASRARAPGRAPSGCWATPPCSSA